MFPANGLSGSPSCDLASLYDSACRDFDLDLLDAPQVHSPSSGESSDGPGECSAPSGGALYEEHSSWDQPSPVRRQQQAPPAGTALGSAHLPAVLEAWASPSAGAGETRPSASLGQEGQGPLGWEPSPRMHQWPPQDDPQLERKRVRALRARLSRQRAKESREHLQHDLDQVKAQLSLLTADKTRRRQRIAILEAHLALAPEGHVSPLQPRGADAGALD